MGGTAAACSGDGNNTGVLASAGERGFILHSKRSPKDLLSAIWACSAGSLLSAAAPGETFSQPGEQGAVLGFKAEQSPV